MERGKEDRKRVWDRHRRDEKGEEMMEKGDKGRSRDRLAWGGSGGGDSENEADE